MLSGDTIIQASATLTVGVIFLVNLRKTPGVRVTRASVGAIFIPVYFWLASTVMILWADMSERAGKEPGLFTLLGWYNLSELFFIVGVVALVMAMVETYGKLPTLDATRQAGS